MTPPEIYRLTYVSHLTLNAASRLASTAQDILVESVRNNLRNDITGMLICDGAYFAQALEGPPEAVHACLERIRQDFRNTKLDLREEGYVGDRAFPRWSMCGLSLSSVDDAVLVSPDIDVPLVQMSSGALWQFLNGLAERFGDQLDEEHDRLIRGR